MLAWCAVATMFEGVTGARADAVTGPCNPAVKTWFVWTMTVAVNIIWIISVTLLVAFAMSVALDLNASNILLLPMFAIVSLSIEGMQFLPRLNHPTSIFAGTFLRDAAWEPNPQGWNGLKAALRFLVAFAVLCGLSFLSVIAPFTVVLQMGDRNEVSAVAFIAWIDCCATLTQGFFMLLGITGYHHVYNDPRWHGVVTVGFGAGLLVIASSMRQACSAGEILRDPDLTLHSYHTCEALVSDAAYALAFLSILRQVRPHPHDLQKGLAPLDPPLSLPLGRSS